MWNNSSTKRPRHLKTVRDFVLHCCLVRTLRQHSDFLHYDSGFVIVVLPARFQPQEFKRSTADILFGSSDRFNADIASVFHILSSNKPERTAREYVDDYQATQKVLGLAESVDAIPPVVELAADTIVDLSPITPRYLQAACRVVLKTRITQEQARLILAYPPDRIWPTLRPRRRVEDVLARLAKPDAGEAPPQTSQGTLSLSQMHGYGPAKIWGLELARDLADWRNGRIVWDEVDRGIVLSGPPGVGKTIYARALAQECSAELIATSLSQWQARGHLGDLLRAMRGDFARAKESAPAILFIDELDSIGDRATFSDDHKSYSVQVVNGFLECLDGLVGREGVVVVGATNHPAAIDPAVLRPGRLDRHVEIPHPSAEDRIRILQQHLDLSLDIADLEALKQRTTGLTGADLARAARDAKRIARRAGRPIEPDDVAAALPSVFSLEESHLRANAVHEAGHTLVGLRLRTGIFLGTLLANCVVASASVSIGGQAKFSHPAVIRRDAAFYLDQIALCLAGVAAEKVILGSFSDGAGIVDTSDLASATRLATLMVSQAGMFGTLRASFAKNDQDLEALRRSDPKLREQIDRILREQLDRARSIIKSERPLVEAFAEELVATGTLSPERASEIQAKLANNDRMPPLRAS